MAHPDTPSLVSLSARLAVCHNEMLKQVIDTNTVIQALVIDDTALRPLFADIGASAYLEKITSLQHIIQAEAEVLKAELYATNRVLFAARDMPDHSNESLLSRLHEALHQAAGQQEYLLTDEDRDHLREIQSGNPLERLRHETEEFEATLEEFKLELAEPLKLLRQHRPPSLN